LYIYGPAVAGRVQIQIDELQAGMTHVEKVGNTF
jgi:hypothetical protein